MKIEDNIDQIQNEGAANQAATLASLDLSSVNLAWLNPSPAPILSKATPETLLYKAAAEQEQATLAAAEPAMLGFDHSGFTGVINEQALTALNGADDHHTEKEELAMHREAALVKIDEEISAAKDPSVKERLTALKARLYSATQIADILNVLSIANNVAAQAEHGEHAETPREKADRLWNDSQKAETKAEADWHALDQWKTEDEKKKDKEFEDKLKQEQEELDKLIAAHASPEEIAKKQNEIIATRADYSQHRKEERPVLEQRGAPAELLSASAESDAQLAKNATETKEAVDIASKKVEVAAKKEEFVAKKEEVAVKREVAVAAMDASDDDLLADVKIDLNAPKVASVAQPQKLAFSSAEDSQLGALPLQQTHKAPVANDQSVLTRQG